MNRSILYWKWERSVLEGERYKLELAEMLGRNSFEYLYVSFHHLGVPYDDPELCRALAYTCNYLHEHGRKFLLDVDVRNEYLTYSKRGGKESARIRFHAGELDEEGNTLLSAPEPSCGRVGRGSEFVPPSKILGTWCYFEDKEGHVLPKTVRSARIFCEGAGESATLRVEAGKENAGKCVLVAAEYSSRLPDVFDPAMYGFYDEMLAFYSFMQLDGVANDEWGHDIILEYNANTGIFTTEMFPLSEVFVERFKREYGYSFIDELLYFARFVAGEEGKTYRVVNDYLKLFRKYMRENNEWFYEAGKRLYGKDTFIGVHCTFWGDPYDFGIDILHNAIDWWEVRRDYAQTDEFCILPIRLALMHKWNSPYWYNMWYSGNTQQLHTYFSESWCNVMFGGRTDYLGYECVNESGVFKLRNKGALEQIELMEKEISHVDDCLESTPDSKVLVLFGMESVCNWMIAYGEPKITRRSCGPMYKVLQYANGLFKGCNCDLVPTSEISNGSLKLTEGKVHYGSQEYGAVVFVSPEGVEECAIDFLQKYVNEGGLLAVAGTCRRMADGTDGDEKFAALAKSANVYAEELFTPAQTMEWLKAHSVPTNRVGGGCVYADGTLVVADADAVLPVHNYLELEFTYRGHAVRFSGNDYLVLNFEKGIAACGEGSRLFVSEREESAQTCR